jgi:uncharacterized protein YjbJ (UPF0337 family)
MPDRDRIKKGIENQVEGKGTELRGRVKEELGARADNESLEREGKLDQVKGKVQGAVGKTQRNAGRDD